MGLDMYLSKKIFIGAEYKHRNVKGKISIKIDDVPVKVDMKKVLYIIESVGYWRKANAIHAWFVNNIQDGKDDCQQSYVSYERLAELRDLCKKVIKTKDYTLLPPQEGFFFGSTEVDQYYIEDLKYTIKTINSLDKTGEYAYQASW